MSLFFKPYSLRQIYTDMLRFECRDFRQLVALRDVLLSLTKITGELFESVNKMSCAQFGLTFFDKFKN